MAPQARRAHCTGGPLAGGGGTTDVGFVVDVVSPVAAGLEDIDTAVTVAALRVTRTRPMTPTPRPRRWMPHPMLAVTVDDGGVTADCAGNADRVHGVGDQCW